MNSRRNIVVVAAALCAAMMIGSAQAAPKIYGAADTGWYADTAFRQGVADKLRQFIGATQYPLPLVGYSDDPAKINSVADQFLSEFMGKPGEIEALPDGRWLFSGTAPHQVAYIAFVVMSPDQSNIEAAMMSYQLCPKGGVPYRDPEGSQHLAPCEEDPRWAIFLPRHGAPDYFLIHTLSQVALRNRLHDQRSLIEQNIRSQDSIHVKTEVIMVP